MLFNRTAELIIGPEVGVGKRFTDLRFSFDITKSSSKTPNKCTLRIWNASAESRAEMEVVGNLAILRAGYVGDVGAIQIFAGHVTMCSSSKEGVDWVTELEILDGFLEFRDSKVSISFGAGVTTLQALGIVATKFGLPLRELPNDITDKQYTSGFAFVGRVRDAMDKICDHMGAEWSIQGREIQVVKKGGAYQTIAHVLSSETGMVGSPMPESKTMTEKAASKVGITTNQPGVHSAVGYKKDGSTQEILHVLGYKVKSLLQPLIEPGGFIQVKSLILKGEFFRVESLQHSGDTHSGDWHTTLNLRYTA